MQQRDMPPLEVPGAAKYGCLGAGSISVEVLGFLEGVRFKWGEDSLGLSGAQEETARFPLYAFLTRLPAQRSKDLLERLKKAFFYQLCQKRAGGILGARGRVRVISGQTPETGGSPRSS